MAVRAGEGLLISATARPNSQSTQIDVAETVAQLKAAQKTAKALSEAASQQQALPLKANTAQESFIKAIDPQQESKFTGSVGGQEAKKAQAGSRELGEPTERFAQGTKDQRRGAARQERAGHAGRQWGARRTSG